LCGEHPMVAAIDIAGLAVAFPVDIGTALVVGAISSCLVSPTGNALCYLAAVMLQGRTSGRYSLCLASPSVHFRSTTL
jgi:hypothetical protein